MNRKEIAPRVGNPDHPVTYSQIVAFEKRRHHTRLAALDNAADWIRKIESDLAKVVEQGYLYSVHEVSMTLETLPTNKKRGNGDVRMGLRIEPASICSCDERLISAFCNVGWLIESVALYLCEFAGMDPSEGDFSHDVFAEMNTHISETSSDREPWVWIMETVLSEIDSGSYRHPYTFDMVDDEFCILLRSGHIIDHIAHTANLRDKWNALPVKSDRVFKKQMRNAGVIVGEKEVERRIFLRRVPYLSPISLRRLEAFGLHVSVREDLC